MTSPLSERDWQRQVVELAQRYGWLVHHHFDSRRSEPGFPDLVLVHPQWRRLILAELKTDTGRLSKSQRVWLDALDNLAIAVGWDTIPDRTMRVAVECWRPRDFERVHELLRRTLHRTHGASDGRHGAERGGDTHP